MPSATPKVFIDTNVWFSAFWGSKNCQTLIKAHINNRIIAVISQQVLEEAIKNIKEKIPELLPIFQEFIAHHPPVLVANPESFDSNIKNLINPKNQPIFTSAMMAKVKYFVTGNLKDFQVAKLEKLTGIKVLTPKKATTLLNLNR